MQSRSALASLLAAALAVGSVQSSAAPSANGASAKSASKAPDAKTNAKVNHYIEFMNAETRAVLEARSSWLREIRDPQAGPTCKETNLGTGGGYGTDLTERIAEYRKQFKAKPNLDTDEAALQMVQALEDLQKPTSDADDATAYRNRNSPDRCARIKQVHPRLMAGWQKYVDGLERLDPFVEAFADDRDRRDVELALKKYGRHYRYQFSRIVLVSKSILKRAEKLLQKDLSDTSRMLERMSDLDEAVAETNQLIKSDNDANKNDTYPPGLSLMITDAMPRFQNRAKALAGTLGDVTKRKDPKVVKAAWSEFTSAYNGLVEQLNGVAFSKQQR